MENRVVLGLGGNMGDRNLALKQARDYIQNEIGFIIQESSLFQTSSWGITDQDYFLNQVIIVSTLLNAEKVLKKCMEIELKLGRIRAEKYGSRIIDIDILFFNNEIIEKENLIIPHLLLHKRKFVLVPLMEIISDFVHPVLNKTIEELTNECEDSGSIKIIL